MNGHGGEERLEKAMFAYVDSGEWQALESYLEKVSDFELGVGEERMCLLCKKELLSSLRGPKATVGEFAKYLERMNRVCDILLLLPGGHTPLKEALRERPRDESVFD